MATKNPESGDGLADFILRLPEGERHKGFFWAANTAVEDGLPSGEMLKVIQAGVQAGLDEVYVDKTIAQVRKAHADIRRA